MKPHLTVHIITHCLDNIYSTLIQSVCKFIEVSIMLQKMLFILYLFLQTLLTETWCKPIGKVLNPSPADDSNDSSEMDVNEWKMFQDILSLSDDKGKLKLWIIF